MRIPYWVLNALFFELGWLVCVLAGSYVAIGYTLVALVLHFTLAPVHKWDGAAVLVALLLGLAHDHLLGYWGLLDFSEANPQGRAPLWLTCLWVLMALTLNHALSWFYQRPLWLAVMGAIGGALAYLGGVALSAVQWGVEPLYGFLILMLIWFFVLPLHRLLTLGGVRLWSAFASR